MNLNKTLRVLLIIAVATNPLAWAFAILAVHALAIYLLGGAALAACRKQWALQAKHPRRPALVPSVAGPVIVPSERRELPADAQAAVHQLVDQARKSVRRERPVAPSYAQMTRPAKAKKVKVPSAKRLIAMPAQDLLALGRALGIKKLNTQMKAQTLIARIQAHQEAAHAHRLL